MKLSYRMMQKYFYLLAGLFMASINGALAQENNTVNLVTNAGFEGGAAAWDILENTANIANDVSHSGNHSLHYVNTDSGKYRLFTQSFQVQPGQNLRFSVWIKGKNVVTRVGSEGAGIYVQGYNAEGKYIKGSFPRTFLGTFDWVKAEGEYRVPANVVRVQVGLYLRQKATGEVWFDDVEAHVEKPLPYLSHLQYPNYRGFITENDTATWRMRIERNTETQQKEGQIHIATSLIDSSGKVLLSQVDDAAASAATTSIHINRPQHLAIGDYVLKQQITNDQQEVISTRNFPVYVVAQMPKVYIDAQGFTVVNGERFFPLGIYTGNHGAPGDYRANSEDADLQRMADAGFNSVLSYSYAQNANAAGKQFLDLAAQHHLQVIYSLKDMYDGHAGYPQRGISGATAAQRSLDTLKDHPAVLAWYINDELADSWMKPIAKRYQRIIKSDKDHPAFIVSNQPTFNKRYAEITDILGMDPYPVGYPHKNLMHVTDWTQLTVDAAHGAKGVWQVLQMHNAVHHKSTLDDHPPTLNEMRNMSYQALINGSKGLLYFAYHWLHFDLDASGKRIYSKAAFEKRWPDVQKLVHEIKAITPVILDDRKIDVTVLLPSPVQHQVWQKDDKLYVMVANVTEDKSQSLQLRIPDGWNLTSDIVPGITAEVQNNLLQLKLQALASGVVVLER